LNTPSKNSIGDFVVTINISLYSAQLELGYESVTRQTRQSVNPDAPSEAKNKGQGRLHLDVVIGKSAVVLKFPAKMRRWSGGEGRCPR
jgi:hypothetical protein